MPLRTASYMDFHAILALNDESEHFLSPLDEFRLTQLHEMSAVHWVMDGPDGILGFLLAFREQTDYDSLNYRWFQDRYSQFLYIDRVVVDGGKQSIGVGSYMYQQLFDYAKRLNVACLTCEYDLDPPNPVSERFHRRFGFREVGRQRVADGNKQVSLQLALTGS